MWEFCCISMPFFLAFIAAAMFGSKAYERGYKDAEEAQRKRLEEFLKTEFSERK